MGLNINVRSISIFNQVNTSEIGELTIEERELSNYLGTSYENLALDLLKSETKSVTDKIITDTSLFSNSKQLIVENEKILNPLKKKKIKNRNQKIINIDESENYDVSLVSPKVEIKPGILDVSSLFSKNNTSKLLDFDKQISDVEEECFKSDLTVYSNFTEGPCEMENKFLKKIMEVTDEKENSRQKSYSIYNTLNLPCENNITVVTENRFKPFSIFDEKLVIGTERKSKFRASERVSNLYQVYGQPEEYNTKKLKKRKRTVLGEVENV
ncbi:hypothetical protein HDU92_004629 [Lobulomyces angularis]|nr:hypothetical protein HDU92_004629 [Lobulomyces angularis]